MTDEEKVEAKDRRDKLEDVFIEAITKLVKRCGDSEKSEPAAQGADAIYTLTKALSVLELDSVIESR